MNRPLSPTWHKKDYDVIIVGGSTAGLVVGSRLSELSTIRVLIFEAGSNCLEEPFVKIPALWSGLLGSEKGWCFGTTPQVSALFRFIVGPLLELNTGSTGKV